MIDLIKLLRPIDALIFELEKTSHPSALYFKDAKVQILAEKDQDYQYKFLDALKGIAPMSSYGSFNDFQDQKLTELLDAVHGLLMAFQVSRA